MAVALFGNEGGMAAAAGCDALACHRHPVDLDGTALACGQFARQRGKQFALAIAGDAGNPQQFATPDIEGDFVQGNPMEPR